MNQLSLLDGGPDALPSVSLSGGPDALPPVSLDGGPVAGDRSQLAAALLALQAAMYVVTAIEAAIVSALSGNAAGSGPVILSLLLAGALLWSGRRVRLQRPLRRVRVLQWLLLGWAGIDLALAIFLNDTGLGLLPTFTRMGIPVAIIALLSPRWEK